MEDQLNHDQITVLAHAAEHRNDDLEKEGDTKTFSLVIDDERLIVTLQLVRPSKEVKTAVSRISAYDTQGIYRIDVPEFLKRGI